MGLEHPPALGRGPAARWPDPALARGHASGPSAQCWDGVVPVEERRHPSLLGNHEHTVMEDRRSGKLRATNVTLSREAGGEDSKDAGKLVDATQGCPAARTMA